MQAMIWLLYLVPIEWLTLYYYLPVIVKSAPFPVVYPSSATHWYTPLSLATKPSSVSSDLVVVLSLQVLTLKCGTSTTTELLFLVQVNLAVVDSTEQ